MTNSYDVVVIGSGPGGYVAAIRAAHLGKKVAIVEKDSKLGGTCLLRGCIPTKALLHSADLLRDVQTAREHGIVVDNVSVDFAGVQKSREKIVLKSAAGVAYLMKQNKIDVINGVGRLKDAQTVEVETASGKQSLNTKFIILATGSVPRAVPTLPIDKKRLVSSDEILELASPPKSLLVLGAGAVGVEFASVYSRFGTECTLVEMMDRVLPIEDEEVSLELEKALKKRSIKVFTSTKLEKAEVTAKGVRCTLASKNETQTVEVEMVLVAIGRAPVTANLGLEKVGIKIDKGGFVEVDGTMRTAVPHIYAIGDIVRTPQLAHVASAEGILAVDHLCGKSVHPLNYLHTPSATYCDPEVASIGLSEKKAKDAGYTVKTGKFPFSAMGKARILGQTEGFVKIVSDAKYDEILGIHIIGPRATDLIAEACVAMRLESTTEELAHTIHAHPTLPETIMEAAHAAMGRAIHM